MIAQQTEADMLFDTVKEWAAHQDGWTITLEPREYEVPQSSEVTDFSMLHLHTPQGRIHFEPLGRDRYDRYIVEMYAYPTLIRVFLKRKPGNDWQVFTDAGLPFHWEWNAENFVRLVQDLQVVP